MGYLKGYLKGDLKGHLKGYLSGYLKDYLRGYLKGYVIERRHAIIEGAEKPRVALQGARGRRRRLRRIDVVAAGETQLASSSLPLSSRVRV